jgi:dihydroorotase
MPNLVPPVRNAAGAYRQRILAARPAGSRFEPLMVLYLTDRTSAEDVRAAKASGIVYAAKLYPAGATTNSDSGVTSIDNIFPASSPGRSRHAAAGARRSDPQRDRRVRPRKRFIDEHMRRVVERFPTLKVVFEHITTSDAAQFVTEAPANVGATITASTCCTTATTCWSAAFARTSIACRSSSATPTRWPCWTPPPAATRSSSSAPTRPHAQHAKEAACGCAGCYTAYAAIELYAEAFEQRNALDKLEALPACTARTSTACRATPTPSPWSAKNGPPPSLPFGELTVIPLRAGEKLRWRLLEENA